MHRWSSWSSQGAHGPPKQEFERQQAEQEAAGPAGCSPFKSYTKRHVLAFGVDAQIITTLS